MRPPTRADGALAYRRLVAGSRKTEVVAQRAADRLVGAADGASIIAFTFTEQAAAELKARMPARVEERLGTTAPDRLGAAFFGTIHAYCFRLLQQAVSLERCVTYSQARLWLSDDQGRIDALDARSGDSDAGGTGEYPRTEENSSVRERVSACAR